MILESVREKVLDNGLKIICLRKTGAPVVAAQVWYRAGSAVEKDGQRGLSHFLEHMMFRGSAHVASEEHAQRINDVGGHCNAGTAEDVTMYLNSVPKDHLDMILDLEVDRMVNLSLDREIFETERKVIVEEYHTYMNMPVTKAFLEFRAALYDGHPYALSPLGRIEDVQSISTEDCRAYYDQYYTPANATVVVVGDFESDEIVFEKVASKFGMIPRGGNARTIPEPRELPADAHRGIMKRRVEFDVPMVITGYPAPSSADPDALILEILQMILSQGETSRLHREIVRKKSLAVMAGGMNHFLRLSGMSLFFAAFTPDVSARKVERALNDLIGRVATDGISAEELKKVRNATLTTRALELYSAENICQRLAYGETVEGDYRLWIERLKLLENLDAASVSAVAGKYWNAGRRHTLYLQPKRIRPLLYLVGLGRRIFSR